MCGCGSEGQAAVSGPSAWRLSMAASVLVYPELAWVRQRRFCVECALASALRSAWRSTNMRMDRSMAQVPVQRPKSAVQRLLLLIAASRPIGHRSIEVIGAPILTAANDDIHVSSLQWLSVATQGIARSSLSRLLKDAVDTTQAFNCSALGAEAARAQPVLQELRALAYDWP